jgi:hypothetical protein
MSNAVRAMRIATGEIDEQTTEDGKTRQRSPWAEKVV